MFPICCRIGLISHVITVIEVQFRKSFSRLLLQADLSYNHFLQTVTYYMLPFVIACYLPAPLCLDVPQK